MHRHLWGIPQAAKPCLSYQTDRADFSHNGIPQLPKTSWIEFGLLVSCLRGGQAYHPKEMKQRLNEGNYLWPEMPRFKIESTEMLKILTKILESQNKTIGGFHCSNQDFWSLHNNRRTYVANKSQYLATYLIKQCIKRIFKQWHQINSHRLLVLQVKLLADSCAIMDVKACFHLLWICLGFIPWGDCATGESWGGQIFCSWMSSDLMQKNWEFEGDTKREKRKTNVSCAGFEISLSGRASIPKDMAFAL